MSNYLKIAFTESVKEKQEEYGSRKQYDKIAKIERGTELSFAEFDFIQERDSFYLATVGENGYPYVQFRGGSRGFLKILDSHTLAYADFRGNLQYISVGNLNHNNKASLILMDYVNKRRLKIYAEIEVKKASESAELIAELQDLSYKATIERAMILHVKAFDWNCPQHITQRFTVSEMQEVINPYVKQIEKLQTELDRLKKHS
jgi:hypothetical protein